ncbi:MAG: lipopolysaccharide transport periplasmic protein LptA [Alcanivoracaceae bacterium]|jgi:lipopolysaccharide export system protein LptA|nr:lipopolysaccharide transport periplasmic protein LptA [Alcanivoracaceae bacterium]
MRDRDSRPGSWCASVAAVLALLVMAPQALSAQPPITIRAQQAVVEQTRGHALYTGGAELVQGTRRLQADRIEIFSENNQPVRIEASGSPVTLRDGDTLDAEANRLIYDVPAQEIRLLENARVNHQGREFEGAEVIYSIANRAVKASGGEDNGRVRLVIPAQQAPEKGDEQP